MAGTARRLYDKRSTGKREEWLTSNNVSQLFNLMNEALGRISNLESSVTGITSAGYVGGAGVTNYHAVWSSVDTLRASAHVYDDETNERTGFGTAAPSRTVEIFHGADPQLALTQALGGATTDFQTDANGNLRIDPSGAVVGIAIGADNIPIWGGTYGALHIGGEETAIAGNPTSNSLYLLSNARNNGTVWKSVTNKDSLICEFDSTSEILFSFYDTSAADETLSAANQDCEYRFYGSPNPVLLITAKKLYADGAGSQGDTAALRLIGKWFDDATDVNAELSMQWRNTPSSLTTYKMGLLNNALAEMAYINEAGKAAILNQTIIGSVTVAQIGELDVYQIGCPVNPYLNLRHGDVVHGMTNYLSADAFFLADIRDETYGGVNLIGASVTTAQTPMSIFGIAGAYCGGQPYMKLIVGKDDGASGITNIGDTEIGYDFKDYTQSLVKIYGDGDVWILGNLTINDIPAAISDTDKFLVSDSGLVKYRTGSELLSDIGANTRSVCIVSFASDESAAVGNGTLYLPIPADLNGWNLTAVLCRVIDKGVTGTTDIMVRRVRSATAADMLSTKVTIGDEYYAADGVIDASYDDVATGDAIFIDIDAVHSGTAPNGLSAILTFTKA